MSFALAMLALGCSSTPSSTSDGAAGTNATSQGGSANGGAAGGAPGAAGNAATLGGTGNANRGGASAGGMTTAGATSSAGNGGTDAAAGGGNGAAGTEPVVGVPKNPALPGLNADPQIAAFGGKYYIYPTTDGFDNWLSTSFHAFSSTDLVSWHDEGVILDLGPDVTWADDRAWAPGITEKNGTYYFYFAAAQQIGVATASSPTGKFKDALGHPLIKTAQFGGQSIDPYVFTDDDGRSYLYFGSGSTGHVAELGADMVSLEGTPTTISVGGFREGSVLFKRSGTYYFMWSENDTRSADYDVSYGTGKSPLGPFTKAANNPILKKNTAQGILGTGHNSVLQVGSAWYIAYHRFAIPNGDGTHREVCLDRLEFNADGSIAPVKPTP